jgi:uracil-DNA glycosylase family 4
MSKQRTFIHVEELVKTNTRIKKPTVRKSKKEVEPEILGCETCGLRAKCRHPNINRSGKNKRSILFVGLCPGKDEDRYGIPFVGESGTFLKRMCNLNGIDLDADCSRTNVVRCYPGEGQWHRDAVPTQLQIRCCSDNLKREIEEVNPGMIICLGTEAIQSVLKSTAIEKPNATTLHGKVIPYHRLNCWVGCMFHPSFFIHRMTSREPVKDELLFAYDLANILSVLDRPLPQPLSRDGNICITNADEAIGVLNSFCDIKDVTAFDFETTTLDPDENGADIVSMSISNTVEKGYFIPISAIDDKTGKKVFGLQEQAMILSAIGRFVKSSTPKTIQNFYMEELWCRKFLGHGINNFIQDTMVTSHVVGYSNKGCTGLAFQAMELNGHEYKNDVNKESIINTPLDDLCQYNTWDSRQTLCAYNYQKHQLSFDPKLTKFNNLFTRGLRTLANLKERGIRIDVKMMDTLYDEYGKEGDQCVEDIRKFESVRSVERSQGKDFNPNSPPQLQKLIYDELKVEKTKDRQTPTHAGSTDSGVLEEIARNAKGELKNVLATVRRIKKCAEIRKKITEYRRVIHSDGKIHPTFGLNTADSFRSSAVKPNSMNAYKHDPELKKFRRIFIPEPGQVMVEGDYKSMEVRTIAMASGARELIRYISEKIDPHKYWAGKIFKKPVGDIDADEKYAGKNGFVFPSIYGSLPPAIAKYFGGKFSVDYIKKLQDEFWRELPEVRAWQVQTIEDYYKNGYIEGMSGCKIRGPLSIFQLYNLSIQSTAFHVFLDAFTRIDDKLIAGNFKSMAINEVHDAGVYSVEPSEVDDLIGVATEIMVSKRFDWQGNVPLDVDWEIGENWFEMSSYKK